MTAGTPPLLVVYGTDDFRRERFLRSVVGKNVKDGWAISHVDVGTPSAEGAVGDILSTVGVLFSQPTLCVLRKPEKASEGLVKLLKVHAGESGEPMVVFLLVYETDKPSGHLWDLVPKSAHKGFPLPAFYKMEEAAVSFVAEEARGFKVDTNLATALVRKVGTDFGVLSFEVSKIVTLARSLGVTVVTPEMVKQAMAPLSESDGSGVLDALAFKSTPKVARELEAFRKSKGGDPTIELCGRVLSPSLLRWLQAAHFHASGLSPTVAAGRLSANPWYWENKVLPPARAWGVPGLAKLLSVVAQSQEAVFRGSICPWVVLESGLLRAIEEHSV